MIDTLLFGVLGYLCGSLPFAVWLTHWRTGKDVRSTGSGHATATNAIRQAGWVVGAAVAVLDIAKGFLPTWLALSYAGTEWAAIAAGVGAVLGHCWPIFAGFRGGMGLAATGGAYLAVAPLAFPVVLGFLIALVLLTRHGARSALITGLAAPGILWLSGMRGSILWIAGLTGVVIALRFWVDWNRKYRELWLDREPGG
jgi:glycerol-3-phosphate acyltransferase PlsY